MNLSRLTNAALRFAIVLACGTAGAADPPGRPGAGVTPVLPPVQVAAPRDPVEKSYRNIVRGMDLFEQRRGLAPNASLRFKLLPRSRDANMQGIAVSIVGDSVTIPVPVASDNTFALERSRQALAEDALVMTNRRARSMTWRAEIRTPGLPPNTRRLGDLRLECLVGMESDLVSNVRPRRFFGDIANPVLRARGYCERDEVYYLFFAERPLFSITLVAGNRREILSVDKLYAGISHEPGMANDLIYCDCQVLLDRAYLAPLADRSWPDDTLIVLDYMADGDVPASAASAAVVTPLRTGVIPEGRARDAVAIGRSTRADVAAALGETLGISFDSGFEVWVYRLAEDTSGKRGAQGGARSGREKAEGLRLGEFVVLFAPSGVVVKTRVRLPSPHDYSGSI